MTNCYKTAIHHLSLAKKKMTSHFKLVLKSCYILFINYINLKNKPKDIVLVNEIIKLKVTKRAEYSINSI